MYFTITVYVVVLSMLDTFNSQWGMHWNGGRARISVFKSYCCT